MRKACLTAPPPAHILQDGNIRSIKTRRTGWTEDEPFIDLNMPYIDSSSHNAVYKSWIVASVRLLSLAVTLATLLKICLTHPNQLPGLIGRTNHILAHGSAIIVYMSDDFRTVATGQGTYSTIAVRYKAAGAIRTDVKGTTPASLIFSITQASAFGSSSESFSVE